MTLFSGSESMVQSLVDVVFEKWPQPVPGKEKLQQCKVISHRGERDNITVFENTLEAFNTAKDHGVWGIEFDVRWTRDLVPMVFHDPDLKRIFGASLRINHAFFADLRKAFPLIPTLEEILELYGRKVHLMVEIKEEAYPDPDYQSGVLSRFFSGLSPEEDYHFLSLEPRMFQYVGFVPNSTCLPVARFNLNAMSRAALDHHYAGVAGHYLLLTQRRMRLHRQRHQKIGTGYISSRNCLYREINRGVDWIFSNHAGRIQKMIRKSLVSI